VTTKAACLPACHKEEDGNDENEDAPLLLAAVAFPPTP